MKHKDARATRSRQALIEAGIQLLLTNPMASLKQVAEHAGVGRATLYRHFETREQLIQEIARESCERTDELMAPLHAQQLAPEELIRQMFRVLMPMADRFHFLLSLWSIASEDQEVQQIYLQQLNTLYQMVESLRRAGGVNDQLSNDWILVTIDTLIYAGWWLVAEGKCSAEQAAEQAITTLFNGIGPV